MAWTSPQFVPSARRLPHPLVTMPLSYHARRLALVRLCMRPCVCVLVLGKSVRGKSLTFVTRSLFCSSYLILLGVQVTGARILQGQQRGETGEENYLSWCVVRVFVQLSGMVGGAYVRAGVPPRPTWVPSEHDSRTTTATSHPPPADTAPCFVVLRAGCSAGNANSRSRGFPKRTTQTSKCLIQQVCSPHHASVPGGLGRRIGTV